MCHNVLSCDYKHVCDLRMPINKKSGPIYETTDQTANDIFQSSLNSIKRRINKKNYKSTKNLL